MHLDWDDVESCAKALAGNHRKFESFGWHSRPYDDENWTIAYTHNRDSGLLEESNADAIAKELEEFSENEVVAERHSHWAVGWVDGYVIRVYDARGKVTNAFRRYCQIQAKLADYPVLDEEDYSRRELEATLENIKNEAKRWVKDDAAEDWPNQVYDWLRENGYDSELENTDDQGACPSEECLKEALIELELLDCVYRIYVGDVLWLETTGRKRAEHEFGTMIYHQQIGIGEADAIRLMREDPDGEEVEIESPVEAI